MDTMLELGLYPTFNERTVFVQEEPALEIALPQVFEQPLLVTVQRGKLLDADALAIKIARRHAANPEAALGADYQQLVTEFQPIFSWTIACWDYLLSTQGCRFVSRNGEQRWGVRGDYSAFTDKDYSRLVHGIFRQCILELPQDAAAIPLSQWLREQCWPRILEAYQRLEQPTDTHQRILTPYSYLRCVPYQFLNEFHHELVYTTLKRFPQREKQAIDTYFLHFFTEHATAQATGCSLEECLSLLHQGLVKLLIHHRLVYCLLRQIERY